MPGPITQPLDKLEIKELHRLFGAEISGVDFSKFVPEDTFQQILAASAQYGVIVFRNTGLDNLGHVEFARRFGDLCDMRQLVPKGKTRFEDYELADLSNIDVETGEPIAVDSPKAHIASLTAHFHADLSYKPRRASFSILRAHEIPPAGYGGNTEFADTRTAFDEIEPDLKKKLLTMDYIGAHSWQHLQKRSNPELFKNLDPTKFEMAQHKLVQLHAPSNRMNLYTGSYVHHIEGPPEKSEELARLHERLIEHATQKKYCMSVEWKSPGDMVIWDNRAVLHRAGPGTYAGRFKRDLRRATVIEASS